MQAFENRTQSTPLYTIKVHHFLHVSKKKKKRNCKNIFIRSIHKEYLKKKVVQVYSTSIFHV